MELGAARERLRTLSLALPEAHEVQAWGDPTYRVRNKIFSMEKGAGTEVWFKGEPGAQPALMESDPECYFVPPYVGSKGWIGACLGAISDWTELKELVEISYCLIAPKKLSALIEGRDEAARGKQ